MSKKTLRIGLQAAVIAGLLFAGMRYVHGGQILAAVRRFEWSYAPLVLALAVAYLLVKGWRFVNMLGELTSTDRGTLLRAYVAGQACALLPGGMAARAGMLEQAGIPAEKSAAPLAVSSLSDQALLAACAIISALWMESVRRPAAILLAALTVLSLVLGIESSRKAVLRLLEKLMNRFQLLAAWRVFLDSLRRIATWDTVAPSLINTAVSFALLILALDLCVRGVGAQASWTTVLLAYTLPAMLGRISAMPAGVGVTEAGMVALLYGAPMQPEQAAAATVLFRAGTVLFGALVGAVVYFACWRRIPESAA